MIDMYIFDFQTYWSSSKKGNKNDLCDIEVSSEASREIYGPSASSSYSISIQIHSPAKLLLFLNCNTYNAVLTIVHVSKKILIYRQWNTLQTMADG